MPSYSASLNSSPASFAALRIIAASTLAVPCACTSAHSTPGMSVPDKPSPAQVAKKRRRETSTDSDSLI